MIHDSNRKIHKSSVQQQWKWMRYSFHSIFFFFICKSNCKLSHNDSSVYVETNGCNIKINEDITMNPNYDTEYGVQAHSLAHTHNRSLAYNEEEMTNMRI